MILQGGLELKLVGLIGTDEEGYFLVHMTGYDIPQDQPEGASPMQALQAIREEASRQPFRFYADFVGADPRFREPVMSGEDGQFRAVGGEMEPCMPTYPDGNPKTAMGMKKPDLSVVPPVALLHLATAMMNGANKYGPFNWRDQPISYRPYLAAAMRHLASCLDGEDFSADTVEAELPVHHLGHVMACCAIALDAIHCGTINDDRPKVPGQTGEAIERYNREKRLLPA